MLKWILFLLQVFLLPHIGLKAQYTNQQIDTLFFNAAQFRIEGNYQACLQVYRSAQILARQNNYKAGIARSYLLIGEIHHLYADWAGSMRYLDTAVFEMNGISNFVLEARILNEKARNYERMSLDEQAVQHFDKALAVAPQIENEKQRVTVMNHIYSSKATMYESRKNISQYYIAIENAYNISPSPLTASRMARYFLVYNKNMDSARTYIERAYKMWESGGFNNHNYAVLLRNHGLYYFTMGKYTDALALYKKSFVLSRTMNYKDEELLTYKMIAEVEEKIKNTADTSLLNFKMLEDTLMKKARESQKEIINKEQKNEQQKQASLQQEKKNKLWIYGLTVVVLLISAFVFSRFQKRKPV